MEILYFIGLIAIVSAIIGPLATRMIDHAMDYGHLLGFIRKGMANRIVKRSGEPELDKKWRTIQAINYFPDRLDKANEFYFTLATKSKWFVGWICPVCLGFRITSLVVIFISLFVNFYVINLTFPEGVVAYVLAIPISNFITLKLYQ